MVRNICLFIVGIFFFSSIVFSARQNKIIGDYISLEINFSRDTVSFGDSAILNLIFYNKSNSLISFSKEDLIILLHSSSSNGPMDYSEERFMYQLNNSLLNKKDANILPKQTLSLKIKVLIKNTFFFKGDNKIRAFYDFKFFHDKSYRKKFMDGYEIVGYLWSSNNVKVVVK